MSDNLDYLNLLRKIQKKLESSQHQLAKELGFSLGKLNYCLGELKIQDLIKIKNFKKNIKKINCIYVLTPKGVSEKTKLTLNFLKVKMKEYDELKNDMNN